MAVLFSCDHRTIALIAVGLQIYTVRLVDQNKNGGKPQVKALSVAVGNNVDRVEYNPEYLELHLLCSIL